MLSWNYTGTMKDAYDGYISGFLAKEPRVSAVNIEAQPFVNFGDVLNVRLSAKDAAKYLVDQCLDRPAVREVRQTGRPDADHQSHVRTSTWLTTRTRRWRPGRTATNWSRCRSPTHRTWCSTTTTSSRRPAFPRRSSCRTRASGPGRRCATRPSQLVDKQAAKYGLLLNNNIFTNGFRNLIDIYAAVRRRAVERRWPDVHASTRRRRSRRRSSSGT